MASYSKTTTVVTSHQGPGAPKSSTQHHTVVVQPQPVIVQQPVVRSQAGGLLSDLGRAFDTAVTDVSKATVEVVTTATNPIDFLRSGNVVQITSKLSGKSLRVLENGLVDCLGDKGTACQFLVLSAGPGTSAIKLQNMAQGHFRLALVNGYFVGYGQGGTDCDLIPSATLDHYVTFEFACSPGAHVGVLPSGQPTAPKQTTKQTDASHFWIRFIRHIN